MDEPLVSVITPTFNHGEFIKKCIESVISQTYSKWEMIIIDDGSTDNTPKIIEQIIEQYRDERIHYIRQSRRGIWKLRETYNRALKYSDGELIAILEGDDFWPPYKLEKQVNIFKKDEKVVLCWGKAGIYHNDKEKIVAIRPTSIQEYKLSKYESTRKLILEGNFIPAVTVIIRREALESIGGFKQESYYTPYVDYPTWLELSLIGEFKALNEVLGYWRIHNQQVTKKYRELMFKGGARLVTDFFNKLPCNLKNLLKIEHKDILESITKRVAMNYIIQGRQYLLISEWRKARECFVRSLNSPLPIKLRSMLGILLSYLQIDMEWLAKLFGKESVIY